MVGTGIDRRTHDVLVVGAGFAGIYAVHRLREAGYSVHCLDAADDVGGVWWWNRYPGARCDVESLDYSYSFSPEIQAAWRWEERYATQPQILAYLRFVADRLGIREHATFGTRVTAARYDATAPSWTVVTDDGSERTARRLVWATGPLSVPLEPQIEGLDSFGGRVLHSGRWPHEPVDLAGRRVACLGTGSSGIQMVPRLAEAAEHLFVLQRTPNFSIPAHNYVFDDARLAEAVAGYDERRRVAWASAGGTPSVGRDVRVFDVDAEERRRIFEEAWAVGGGRFTRAFADLVTDAEANAEAVAFVHDKIRSTVHDPEVAERLLPRDHALGARRICVDTGYYETYNRDDVTLVDLRAEPLRRATERGVVVGDRELEIDDLVLATGFDGLSGALDAIDVVGRDGRRLRDAWADGPDNYLGMAVHGFPDMVVLNGPGSPSVLANMVLTSEQQVNWMLGLFAASGECAFEATARAQADWVAQVDRFSEPLLAKHTRSWYTGANVAGKARGFAIFAGGFHTYGRLCAEVAERDYEGFDLRRPAHAD